MMDCVLLGCDGDPVQFLTHKTEIRFKETNLCVLLED